MIKRIICRTLFAFVALQSLAYGKDSAACRESCKEELASCKAALLYNCDGSYKDCLAGCPEETPAAVEQGGDENRKDTQAPKEEPLQGQEQEQRQDQGAGQPPIDVAPAR